MTEPPRVFLVANPHSGQERGAEALELAAASLRGLGVDVVELPTEGPGHAVELARQVAEEGATHLGAVGGDGTLHEVVQGVMQAEREGPPPLLGTVPVGGGNDYARALGLSPDPALAARVLVEGRARQVDLGRLEGLAADPRAAFAEGPRWVINNLALGFTAEANAARERTRALPGRLGYVAAGGLAVFGFHAQPVEVTVDGLTVAGSFPVVHVGIGPYCGAGETFTPDATMDSGAFHVFVLGERSRLRMLREWRRIASGQQVEDACQMQGQRVRLRGPRGHVLHVDGEIYWSPGGVVDATLLPGAARVAAPA